MNEPMILASASPWRRQMLEQAGLAISAEPANIDERAVERTLHGTGTGPEDVALILAEAKARAVSERSPNALVLGADQVLSLDDRILHKAANMEEARRRLLTLSGKTHQLSSAIVLCRNGEALWRHVDVARLTMRPLDPAFIGRYLAEAGEGVLGSVGVYQIEGLGIQLFEAIEGDYWTIVGLPLLPLLGQLRSLGVIDG